MDELEAKIAELQAAHDALKEETQKRTALAREANRQNYAAIEEMRILRERIAEAAELLKQREAEEVAENV